MKRHLSEALKGLIGMQPVIFSVILSVALVEMIVSGMGWLLKGAVTYDYLLTGLVASLPVSALISKMLISGCIASRRVGEIRADAILNSATDGIHVVDSEGTLIEANEAFWTLTGYDKSWLGRLKVWDWEAGHDQHSVKAVIDELIKTGTTRKFDSSFVHRDGHLLSVQVSVKGFRIDGRDLFYASAHDISERKQAENRLRESEQRFRNIANAAPIMIWKTSPGRQDSWFSRGWLDFTGRGTEFAGICADAAHPDDQIACRKNCHQAARTAFKVECRLKHHSGAYRWVICNGMPGYDEKGEFLGYTGSCVDIEMQKNLEANLRLSSTVFENARESIVVTDSNGCIVAANKGFTNLTGYQRTEVLGRNPRFLQSGHQPPEFYREMWDTLKECGHWSGEMWNRNKSGELYAQLLSVTAINNDHSEHQYYLGVSTNISSLKDFQDELAHLELPDLKVIQELQALRREESYAC